MAPGHGGSCALSHRALGAECLHLVSGHFHQKYFTIPQQTNRQLRVKTTIRKI